MKEDQVQIEISYTAMSPLLSESFKGKVIAKFVNTAVLQITEHAKKDRLVVSELNHRITVRYADLRKEEL